MELLIVLIALGVGGYFFLKSNTRRGAETVRAYVYLSAIATGRSAEDANRLAAFDMTNAPGEVIRRTKEAVERHYGGKQLPMIGEAYRKGMQSNRSALFTNIVQTNAVTSAQAATPERVMRGSGTDRRATRATEAAIPPFSAGMMETGRETVEWCRKEISAYVRASVETMPDFGLDHDINVGSYICGFVQGQFIESGHLKRCPVYEC